MNYVEQVAEAIWGAEPKGQGVEVRWDFIPEGEREIRRAQARAVIDALGLTEEWGVLSPREADPHLIFDFPESAEKVAAARISQGMAADVVCRLVSPWTRSGGGE